MYVVCLRLCLCECGPSTYTLHAYDSIKQLIAQFMCACVHVCNEPFGTETSESPISVFVFEFAQEIDTANTQRK